MTNSIVPISEHPLKTVNPVEKNTTIRTAVATHIFKDKCEKNKQPSPIHTYQTNEELIKMINSEKLFSEFIGASLQYCQNASWVMPELINEKFGPCKRINGGTNGTIYTTPNNPHIVIKALHISHLTLEKNYLNREEDIHEVIRKGLYCQSLIKQEYGFAPLIQSVIISNRDYYIVMDKIEGMNLREFFAKNPKTILKITPVVLNIMTKLQHIHKLGITHGDIKQENIMIKDDNEDDVIFIDFDLAEPHVEETDYASREKSNDLQCMGNILYQLYSAETCGGFVFEDTIKTEIAYAIKRHYNRLASYVVNDTVQSIASVIFNLHHCTRGDSNQILENSIETLRKI